MKRALKTILCRTPLKRFVLPRHRSNFAPIHLKRLLELLDETSEVPGSIVEVGCSVGETTVWLNKHLDYRGMDKPYVAIDTFGGFTKTDVAYEISNRGKRGPELSGFTANSKALFDRAMKLNGLNRVVSIQADVNNFRFAELAPIAFALLDVDLYRPMLSALEGVLPSMGSGGVIVVDDCIQNKPFDGSYQAFMEFTGKHHLDPLIELDRLGVIRKAHDRDLRDTPFQKRITEFVGL
jgi:O-methyltransferase